MKKIINVNEEAEKNLSKDLANNLNDLKNRIDELIGMKNTLQIYEKDILKLKFGSIALMEQITTISKMRIYKPKNSSDLLYGVKFSNGAMNKINEKLKELYLYNK